MNLNPNYTLRTARPEDAALLAELGERTFRETFAKDNTPEDMAGYLSRSFSPEIQTAELARPGSLFLILEIDGTPAGYVHLQDGAADACLAESAQWSGLHAMELIRIYLLQAWTGRRLGDVLMQASIAEAQRQGVEALWLGVWERNPRAIAFYRRWGFEKIGEHEFLLGTDLQTDHVMAQRLLADEDKKA